MKPQPTLSPALRGERVAFDFIFDCQTFHCLHRVDRGRTAVNYASLLRPGGRLLMLTGSAEEPTDRGPVRLTRAEVEHAFDPPGASDDDSDDDDDDDDDSDDEKLPLTALVARGKGKCRKRRKRPRPEPLLRLKYIRRTFFDWTDTYRRQQMSAPPLAWLSLWEKKK